MDNYLQLVERIANSANVPVEEVERKVEAKRAKLSGLVSKEGAAQIVASELGINFEKEKMKIAELVQGMKRAHIIGKIISASPVRTYVKQGKEGKVANFVLADDSANVKVVLWDTNHIKLIEDGSIGVGKVIEISNGMVRNGELHLSGFADIKVSGEKMSEVVSEVSVKLQKLSEVKPGQNVMIRGFIVQSFEPRYFEVCVECGKKVTDGECGVHGKTESKKRALLSLVLDDGSETMRAVLFSESITKLGITDEVVFSLEAFQSKKVELLGEEKFFSGNVRSNQLYNTTEFIVNGIEDVNHEKLIQELEGK